MKPRPDMAGAMDALRGSLKAGVTVRAVPQLFPTPAALAARMVALAGICEGMEALEPSAGTARIIDAIRDTKASWFAVEQDHGLCEALARRYGGSNILQADFLDLTPTRLGLFDRVIMNPPFINGADIVHIQHALAFVKQGGALVAICANGPRQAKALQASASHWEVLPAGTFEGTQVSSVLLRIDVK